MLRAIIAAIVWLQLSLLGIGTANLGNPPAFFFAAAGSDTNPCTQAQPCQTITKANTLAAGSVAKFNGGDTFSTTTGITANVSITSYGAGQATITSGNSAPCISQTNPSSAVSISNIVCTGGGDLTSTTAGILFSITASSNFTGPTISGVTVSGYGDSGIKLNGHPTLCYGFINTSITGNTIHDVTGGVATDSDGTAAILALANGCYGFGTTTPVNVGGNISNNTIYNIPGIANPPNWSGAGIVLKQSSGFTISDNTIHDFAASNNHCTGPSGVLVLDVTDIKIQRNSIYNGSYASGACDSNGIDVGYNITNLLIEGNYIFSPGDHCMIFTNTAAGSPAYVFGNITARWNICQTPKYGSDININVQANPTGPLNIYNNTLINQRGDIITEDAPNAAGVVAVIANNIFVGGYGGTNILLIPYPSSLSFTGNDYYTYNSSQNISWNGTNYTSFAAWQTATGQEKIAGSNVGLTSNPKVYVPGGGWGIPADSPALLYAYNLQSGSPMAGAGLNTLTQFGLDPGTSDYYGNAVTASTLPVGAAAGDFGTFTASCTAASTFLARVSSFTKADNVNYNSLLCGMNFDGDLALTDALYMQAAPNSAASLLNLVSTSYSLVSHGTTTFAARTGITGNGTTGYLDTQFVPSTAAGHCVLNSCTFASYDLTNRTAAGGVGAGGGSSLNAANAQGLLLAILIDTHTYVDVNNDDGPNNISYVTPNSHGFWFAQRTSSSSIFLAQNGGTVATNAASTSTALPAFSMAILATNDGGTIEFFGADQVAATIVGGGLNMVNVSRRINSFTQAYGVNTY